MTDNETARMIDHYFNMTPNEKAAHYVDWRPNTPCADTTWTLEELGARCDECGYFVENEIHVGNRKHMRQAPDMNDPRNYMKALMEIQPVSKRRVDMLAALSRVILNHDHSYAVEYLAALYDAEHELR